jgi:hypothetical protein
MPPFAFRRNLQHEGCARYYGGRYQKFYPPSRQATKILPVLPLGGRLAANNLFEIMAPYYDACYASASCRFKGLGGEE